MNNLFQGVATAARKSDGLATVGSSHVWLDLTAVPKKDRDDLLAAPVSSEGLLGLNLSVAQCLKMLEEENAQLSWAGFV